MLISVEARQRDFNFLGPVKQSAGRSRLHPHSPFVLPGLNGMTMVSPDWVVGAGWRDGMMSTLSGVSGQIMMLPPVLGLQVFR